LPLARVWPDVGFAEYNRPWLLFVREVLSAREFRMGLRERGRQCRKSLAAVSRRRRLTGSAGLCLASV